MGILTNKRILITGVASNRSIATGIADAMYREGAELAFTYVNERLRNQVLAIAEGCGSTLLFKCDVSSNEEIKSLFQDLSAIWPTFDGIVHSIAYAPMDQLKGDYLEVITREGFIQAHEISAYSFAALAKEALPFLNQNSSLIALTYLGAERSMPNYNVMGPAKASLEANIRYMAMSLGAKNIRVNGISAGPIRTLSSSLIPEFKRIQSLYEKNAPLKRCVTKEEVGNCAAFLASDLSSGITGEILHVDNGFNTTVVSNIDLFN